MLILQNGELFIERLSIVECGLGLVMGLSLQMCVPLELRAAKTNL